MPLLYQQNINYNTAVGVWHILEPEEFFLQSVTLQKNISHPHKRLQHLAGRYLLTEVIPGFPLELIKIADTKKPFLEDEAYHFSISHCGDYAAVIVSSENRVGADIEMISHKAITIKNKFLNPAEQKIFELIESRYTMETMLTLAWSIKETIFKWQGSIAVDFREHLLIEKIVSNVDTFTATCLIKKNKPMQFNVHGLLLGETIFTWLVT